MYLKNITLANFKNYPSGEFSFSDKINCFAGNNGVGKTNLLDAIHYLSFCKSFFNTVDIQNIRHGEEFFNIQGTFVRNDNSQALVQCIQKRTHRKRFLMNKKEYDRMADHIGNFPLVMISPYDRDLINDGSEIRRKYIDSVISQFDKIYLDDLIQYQKALAQRNALLKQFSERRTFSMPELETWNEQMITRGEEIFAKRKEFLSQFVPIFRHYYTFISGEKETVDVEYLSKLHDGPFREILEAALPRDREAQFSTAGIHRDDLDFLIAGHAVKKFGSQGQQKSFVIALKLAQFDFTKKIRGFKPIILLDDIFDKLDDLRVRQLISLVSENNFGQVFITDTSEARLREIFDTLPIDHKIFLISPANV